jgi:predicted HTH domain antitoxin
MTIQITIPDSVAEAMRLPHDCIQETLSAELALSLYARGILSFGKARELTGMGKYEFGQLLGQRGIPRHYGREELEDDLRYARGE